MIPGQGMNFEQWLTKLDPNTAGIQFLFWLLVVGSLLFVWKKLWPWFITEYWPAQVKERQARLEADIAMERERNSTLSKIAEALVTLKVLVEQNLDKLADHDNWSRNFALRERGVEEAD